MTGGNVTEKITPETYEKMNKEFEEEGTAFTNQSSYSRRN